MTGHTHGDSTTSRRLIDESSRVLADAFAHDPWANHVLADRAEREPTALATILRTPVRLASERGGLVTQIDESSPSRSIVAVSTWVPMSGRRLTAAMALRTGAIALPMLIGPRAFLRLTSDEHELHARLDRRANASMAYLWVLGVRRSHHGRGLGRAVVDTTCAQALSRGFTSLLLNTDNAANVAVYERLGFALVESGARASGLTTHVMLRQLP